MPNGGTFTGNQVQFDNLCPGTYWIDVSDVNGCSSIITATVFQDSISGVIVDAIVSNGNACPPLTVCDASINVVASNGIAPYAYSIDFGLTFQDSSTFYGLCPGTYLATVVDGVGCEGEYSFA